MQKFKDFLKADYKVFALSFLLLGVLFGLLSLVGLLVSVIAPTWFVSGLICSLICGVFFLAASISLFVGWSQMGSLFKVLGVVILGLVLTLMPVAGAQLVIALGR